MLQAALQMLNTLDAFLAKNDSSSKLVSDVLAIYRGPDVGGLAVKNGTVTQLRRAAFPRCAEVYDAAKEQKVKALVCDMSYQNKRPLDPSLADGVSSHFAGHVKSAVKALGELGRFGEYGPSSPTGPVVIESENGTLKVALGSEAQEKGFASLTSSQVTDLAERLDAWLDHNG